MENYSVISLGFRSWWGEFSEFPPLFTFHCDCVRTDIFHQINWLISKRLWVISRLSSHFCTARNDSNQNNRLLDTLDYPHHRSSSASEREKRSITFSCAKPKLFRNQVEWKNILKWKIYFRFFIAIMLLKCYESQQWKPLKNRTERVQTSENKVLLNQFWFKSHFIHCADTTRESVRKWSEISSLSQFNWRMKSKAKRKRFLVQNL